MRDVIIATPRKGALYAEAGPYEGDFEFDSIVDRWDGRAARHFVSIDYYKDFMPEKGLVLYEDTYGEYNHFVFIENNDDAKEVCEIYIDHETVLLGQWFCCLWTDELCGFPSTSHAQAFFYWLTSEHIQDLIYERAQTAGTQAFVSPSTPRH